MRKKIRTIVFNNALIPLYYVYYTNETISTIPQLSAWHNISSVVSVMLSLCLILLIVQEEIQ